MVTSLRDLRSGGWVLAFVALLGSPSLARAHAPYASPDSTEAWVEYTASVEGRSTLPPSDAQARAWVDEQIQYSIGPMRMGQGGGEAAWYGAPEVVFLSREALADGRYRVQYSLRGRAAISHSVEGEALELFLVRSPDEATSHSAGCASSSPLWYYWLPTADCQLMREGLVDRVTVRFQRIPNTVRTYFEYDRMFVGGVARVDALLGFSEYDETDWSSTGSSYPAMVYRDAVQRLRSKGYNYREWSEAEIRSVYTDVTGRLPSAGTLSKNTRQGRIDLRLVIANTGLEYDSGAFHHFYRDALENASAIVYLGHAGLGKNVNLKKIEARRGFTIRLPKDRYQILHLGSCLPYVYYTRDYLAAKSTPEDPRGSKNLDIAGYGVESYFTSRADVLLRYVEPLEAWANGASTVPSIQELASVENSLFGVSGDEDNPTEIPGRQ